MPQPWRDDAQESGRRLLVLLVGFSALLPLDVLLVMGVNTIEVAWTAILIIPLTLLLRWRGCVFFRWRGWPLLARAFSAHAWLIISTMAWLLMLLIPGAWIGD